MKPPKPIEHPNAPAGYPVSTVDNRREPRYPAHGTVEIRWDDPVIMVVQGFLVDISHSGFRMRHSCQALEAGTIVNFVHDEAQGRARVVWTRLTASRF